MSNSSTEATCLKLIFAKFAGSVKKVPVRYTGAYHHKKLCRRHFRDVMSQRHYESIYTSAFYFRCFQSHDGGCWRSALLSPDGVAPSRMVCVSACVNLPLHHKVQKFSSGTGSTEWSWKRAVKRLCCGILCKASSN